MGNTVASLTDLATDETGLSQVAPAIGRSGIAPNGFLKVFDCGSYIARISSLLFLASRFEQPLVVTDQESPAEKAFNPVIPSPNRDQKDVNQRKQDKKTSP